MIYLDNNSGVNVVIQAINALREMHPGCDCKVIIGHDDYRDLYRATDATMTVVSSSKTIRYQESIIKDEEVNFSEIIDRMLTKMERFR